MRPTGKTVVAIDKTEEEIYLYDPPDHTRVRLPVEKVLQNLVDAARAIEDAQERAAKRSPTPTTRRPERLQGRFNTHGGINGLNIHRAVELARFAQDDLERRSIEKDVAGWVAQTVGEVPSSRDTPLTELSPDKPTTTPNTTPDTTPKNTPSQDVSPRRTGSNGEAGSGSGDDDMDVDDDSPPPVHKPPHKACMGCGICGEEFDDSVFVVEAVDDKVAEDRKFIRDHSKHACTRITHKEMPRPVVKRRCIGWGGANVDGKCIPRVFPAKGFWQCGICLMPYHCLCGRLLRYLLCDEEKCAPCRNMRFLEMSEIEYLDGEPGGRK